MSIHKRILERITTIASISGSNDKKEILALSLGTPVQEYFIQFLNYVFNEVKYTYNIKKIPEIDIHSNCTADIDTLFQLLEVMNTGTGGEEIKNLVAEFIGIADTELYLLFEMCINRSIDCGIELKTVAKTFPELDHLIVPYMRCEKEEMLDKRIVYPAIAQIKADGLFINTFFGNPSENISPKYITRYGNEAIIEGPLFEKTKLIPTKVSKFSDHILMGEFLVLGDDNKPLPREVGNGLINSYIKRFSTIKTAQIKIDEAKTEKSKQKLILKLEEKINGWKELEKRLVIKYWDLITVDEWVHKKSTRPYVKRIETLNSMLKEVFNIDNSIIEWFIPIRTKIVYNKKEIDDFFLEVLELGEEGLVVKNLELNWQHDATRQGMIKLKEFKDCDLICVGYQPGEGEYTGGIGALICESSDGLLKVDPSSGLSMEQRGLERVDMNDSSKGWKPIDGFDLNQYNKKVVALKFNTIQKAENSDTYSLFIPKIMEIRESFDKIEADDLETILKS